MFQQIKQRHQGNISQSFTDSAANNAESTIKITVEPLIKDFDCDNSVRVVTVEEETPRSQIGYNSTKRKSTTLARRATTSMQQQQYYQQVKKSRQNTNSNT